MARIISYRLLKKHSQKQRIKKLNRKEYRAPIAIYHQQLTINHLQLPTFGMIF